MEITNVEKAKELCLKHASRRESIRVTLSLAVGSYTSGQSFMTEDVPPFSRALMDGYAVSSQDVMDASAEKPVRLQVIDQSPAGSWPQKKLTPFTAVRTMTGAPLTEGSDAIIRLEHVRNSSPSTIEIEIESPIMPGESVQMQGEDLVKGTLCIEAGVRIGSPEIAMLATSGAVEVDVVRKPRIGILTTGDELTLGGFPLTKGQIRNSNGPMLEALLTLQGFTCIHVGSVKDQMDAVVEAAENILEQVDVLVTTGGVSVGDYDIVPFAMKKCNMELLFHRVQMRPGKPLAASVRGDKLWFALPGNPAAAYLTSQLFLLPALRQMAGASKLFGSVVLGTLSGIPTLKTTPLSVTSFWPAKAYLKNGSLYVDASRKQSASSLMTLMSANAIVEMSPGSTPEVGQTVSIHLIGEVGAE